MKKTIDIGEFLILKSSLPILDVRAPIEYEKSHIPSAINLPIFSNEERAEIGLTYKEVGREAAILRGLDLTAPKWSGFIEKALVISPNKKVLVHCWRGGMRSNAMAWILDFYGFDVYLLDGGYKKYRQWVLAQFEKDYSLCVLGGMTGSHKTDILHEMEKMGEQVIDLEGLAQHLGSSFGSMNKLVQPSQDQFENDLAEQLYAASDEECVWTEDESSLIGKIRIPKPFFMQIRNAELIELQIPYEERLEFLADEYGVLDKAFLIEASERISKRLGYDHAKEAIEAIQEDRIEDFIKIVLVYYDKSYKRGLSKRDSEKVHSLELAYENIQTVTKQVVEMKMKLGLK